MTPQEFADYANKMVEIREASYIPGRAYGKSWNEAATEAGIPKEWHWPIILFCFDGYTESGQWCAEHGSKK